MVTMAKSIWVFITFGVGVFICSIAISLMHPPLSYNKFYSYVVVNKDFFHSVSLLCGAAISTIGVALGYYYFIVKQQADSEKEDRQNSIYLIEKVISRLEDVNKSIACIDQKDFDEKSFEAAFILQEYTIAYFLLKRFAALKANQVGLNLKSYSKLYSYIDSVFNTSPSISEGTDKKFCLKFYCNLYCRTIQDLHAIIVMAVCAKAK